MDNKYAFFPGCLIPIRFPQVEISGRLLLKNLGVELVDIPEFTCCPDPWNIKTQDVYIWLAMAGRNLALAEEKNLDIITFCSGCASTLTEALHLISDNQENKNFVNTTLAKINKKLDGNLEVYHLAKFLRDVIGLDNLKKSIKRPLENLSVAVHYGCHLLKPSHILNIDATYNPNIVENILETVSIKPVNYRYRLNCCGVGSHNPDVATKMTIEKLEEMKNIGVDCVTLVCPTCFDRFDVGQLLLQKRLKTEYNVPVLYLTQILALAQGHKPEEIGIERNKILTKELVNKFS